MQEGDQMEEMKEGFLEKSNHEITEGEESLTGTGEGGRLHGDWVVQEWHILLKHRGEGRDNKKANRGSTGTDQEGACASS